MDTLRNLLGEKTYNRLIDIIDKRYNEKFKDVVEQYVYDNIVLGILINIPFDNLLYGIIIRSRNKVIIKVDNNIHELYLIELEPGHNFKFYELAFIKHVLLEKRNTNIVYNTNDYYKHKDYKLFYEDLSVTQFKEIVEDTVNNVLYKLYDEYYYSLYNSSLLENKVLFNKEVNSYLYKHGIINTKKIIKKFISYLKERYNLEDINAYDYICYLFSLLNNIYYDINEYDFVIGDLKDNQSDHNITIRLNKGSFELSVTRNHFNLLSKLEEEDVIFLCTFFPNFEHNMYKEYDIEEFKKIIFNDLNSYTNNRYNEILDFKRMFEVTRLIINFINEQLRQLLLVMILGRD